MLPSRPKAVLISLVASYLLSALLLFILAFVLYKLKLKESQIAPAVCALYAISCFAGGLLCGKALRTRRFFWGLLTGVLYFLALFTVSILLRHGRRHGRGNFKLSGPCCATQRRRHLTASPSFSLFCCVFVSAQNLAVYSAAFSSSLSSVSSG